MSHKLRATVFPDPRNSSRTGLLAQRLPSFRIGFFTSSAACMVLLAIFAFMVREYSRHIDIVEIRGFQLLSEKVQEEFENTTLHHILRLPCSDLRDLEAVLGHPIVLGFIH